MIKDYYKELDNCFFEDLEDLEDLDIFEAFGDFDTLGALDDLDKDFYENKEGK